jgi:catechol 2,3-dioxygenase-like lactoylglutathione lyase family enzyme
MTSRPYGMTLQVQVGDLARAREFYTALLGSSPEFEPHQDFLEWRVIPGGETWLQAVGVTALVRPLANRVRFGVADIHGERGRLLGLRIDVSPVTALPGVVAFVDFADPWGNALGFYQDLAPSGQQPVVGGSVHDEGHFVTE